MGDEHLDTILATKSDEFIKSSVENLVPNPSESEGEYECDVPACEDFTTFSNILFDFDYDLFSSDDQSFYDEDIAKEIYSNPLFDEEIISTKIDPHVKNKKWNTCITFVKSRGTNFDKLVKFRFDKDVSFEEEVVHQRLRKTLAHVLELSSCIYLDDRAWRS
nr:hypothetical protein [Tanacetum cinerariifolium]